MKYPLDICKNTKLLRSICGNKTVQQIHNFRDKCSLLFFFYRKKLQIGFELQLRQYVRIIQRLSRWCETLSSQMFTDVIASTLHSARPLRTWQLKLHWSQGSYRFHKPKPPNSEGKWVCKDMLFHVWFFSAVARAITPVRQLVSIWRQKQKKEIDGSPMMMNRK